MERLWSGEKPAAPATAGRDLLARGLEPDDERAELAEDEVQRLFDEEIEAATLASSGDASKTDNAKEHQLLDEMQSVADQACGLPNAKVRRLVEWIRKHLCSGARLPGDGGPQAARNGPTGACSSSPNTTTPNGI